MRRRRAMLTWSDCGLGGGGLVVWWAHHHLFLQWELRLNQPAPLIFIQLVQCLSSFLFGGGGARGRWGSIRRTDIGAIYQLHHTRTHTYIYIHIYIHDGVVSGWALPLVGVVGSCFYFSHTGISQATYKESYQPLHVWCMCLIRRPGLHMAFCAHLFCLMASILYASLAPDPELDLCLLASDVSLSATK